jgi:hypothetical protein
MLTVCGQRYYCQAIIVHARPQDDGHAYTFAKVMDNWWELNDEKVEQVIDGSGMLSEDNYRCNDAFVHRFPKLVFYAKVSSTERDLANYESYLVNSIRYKDIVIPQINCLRLIKVIIN